MHIWWFFPNLALIKFLGIHIKRGLGICHTIFRKTRIPIYGGFITQGPPGRTLDLIIKNSWSTHCHQTNSCQNAPLCVVDAREITTWLKLLGLKLVIRDFHTAAAASCCGGTVATAISGSATIAGVKRVKSMILEFPGDWTRLFYSVL